MGMSIRGQFARRSSSPLDSTSIMLSLIEVTILCGLFVSGATALLNRTVQWPVYIKYTTITGYFLQDEPDTNSTTFDYVCCSYYLTIHFQSLTQCRQSTISA